MQYMRSGDASSWSGRADYLSNDLVLLLSNPIDLFHNPSGDIDNHSGY